MGKQKPRIIDTKPAPWNLTNHPFAVPGGDIIQQQPHTYFVNTCEHNNRQKAKLSFCIIILSKYIQLKIKPKTHIYTRFEEQVTEYQLETFF